MGFKFLKKLQFLFLKNAFWEPRHGQSEYWKDFFLSLWKYDFFSAPTLPASHCFGLAGSSNRVEMNVFFSWIWERNNEKRSKGTHWDWIHVFMTSVLLRFYFKSAQCYFLCTAGTSAVDVPKVLSKSFKTLKNHLKS